MLRPLLVSTFDVSGGAARAAYRLHQGLRRINVESAMFSYRKNSDDDSVYKVVSRVKFQPTKLSIWMDKKPLHIYRDRSQAYWSLNWFPNLVASQINSLPHDIVHLHWIGNGFVPIPALKVLKKPIVWTLHDMWTFTGGCHYAGDCVRFRQSCGNCPQLNSRRKYDLSWLTLNRKKQNWEDLNLTIVTPSRWLASVAQSSALLKNARIEVIPNGLDVETYRPHDKAFARRIFNLPQDKKLILAGANEGLRDPRKGIHYLRPALKQIGEKHFDDVELVVLGSSKPDTPQDLGLNAHYSGHLRDDVSLSLLYSAADVFVAPSLQENLSNSVMEALACGTPTVAFNIGGMPDMIAHQENGYLAQAFDVQDLTNGIMWILNNSGDHQKLSHAARSSVLENYQLEHIAKRYLNLYEDIINGSKKMG